MSSTTLRRGAAIVAGAALAVSGLTSSPASADPSPSSSSASTWLAGELTNGLMHNDQYDFDDYGLSIDAGFAEVASGNTATATQIRDAVAAHINDYITGEAFGDTGSTYAGQTAKALTYAQATGGDPTSFGGVNLVTRLESVTAPSGRIGDVSSFGTDYANTIGQSYATRGLNAAGSGEAAAATAFLLKQQCPAGFFRLALGDAQCSVNTDPDTDVTALAMLNLDSQRAKPEVAAALAKATAWLLSVQAKDGAFGGGAVTEAPNSNSSGLAAAALGEQCQVAAARRAAGWVRGFQAQSWHTGALAAEAGAVAYDAAARTEGQNEGITDETADQWRRTTAQAALGLTWEESAPATVNAAAPQGVHKGGAKLTFTITGAAAGERVCVEDTVGRSALLTGTGGPLTYTSQGRRRGGDLAVRVTTGPGYAYGFADVWGKERFRPLMRNFVPQGDVVRFRIKGMEAGEKVRVLVDGKRVDKGRANTKGSFLSRFDADFSLGFHRVKVIGQFKNRVGVTGFRVVE